MCQCVRLLRLLCLQESHLCARYYEERVKMSSFTIQTQTYIKCDKISKKEKKQQQVAHTKRN